MDWVAIAERLGFPAAVICVMGLVIWRASKWVGVRMLDENTGVITVAIRQHMEHVNRMDKNTESLTDSVRDATKAFKEEISTQNDKLDLIAKETGENTKQLSEICRIQSDIRKEIRKQNGAGLTADHS